MREIKFRSWDKAKGYMLPSHDLHKVLIGNGSIVTINYKPRNGGWEPDEPYHLTNPQADNCIPMQFTGLHDKNGKEIYEGDVVEQTYWSNGAKERGVISYSPDARFVWDQHGDQSGYGLSGQDADRREIIGNIYENPELLK
jgi:uncharacterized phage protein (TIGR01671 family)